MTTTLEAPQESEVDAGEAIIRTEDLPAEVKADIIAQREAGTTLAELKANFPQVDPAVIRDVLPVGNARERKAKEAKAKVTETTQGTGGRSGKAKSQPKPKPKVEAKAEPASRYVEGKQVAGLAESVVAARELIGRMKLADLLGVTGSAVWRFEHGRIHPAELDGLISGMSQVDQRIAEGDFVKAERQPTAASPTKAELQHRIEATAEYLRTGTKGLSGKAVATAALALLDPPTQAATESQ
jgi:uncharacterized protein (DUF433 family)